MPQNLKNTTTRPMFLAQLKGQGAWAWDGASVKAPKLDQGIGRAGASARYKALTDQDKHDEQRHRHRRDKHRTWLLQLPRWLLGLRLGSFRHRHLISVFYHIQSFGPIFLCPALSSLPRLISPRERASLLVISWERTKRARQGSQACLNGPDI